MAAAAGSCRDAMFDVLTRDGVDDGERWPLRLRPVGARGRRAPDGDAQRRHGGVHGPTSWSRPTRARRRDPAERRGLEGAGPAARARCRARLRCAAMRPPRSGLRPRPPRSRAAADYVGVYEGDDSRRMEIDDRGRRAPAHDRSALGPAGARPPRSRRSVMSFLVPHPALDRFVLWRSGATPTVRSSRRSMARRWFRGERYDGPTPEPLPERWSGLAGPLSQRQPVEPGPPDRGPQGRPGAAVALRHRRRRRRRALDPARRRLVRGGGGARPAADPVPG